ncbi:DUF2935 domain-containing protein [Oscillibacter valericigenes]|uniref:DUF2935 domain-containing protein n=1 Tax=Oscillibacter valericigenes TaxID=351091 RepID=UPI001F2EBCFD|nr:DUF2935 domain-containing protein [Oscillibacter valericigenes]MCF2617808.1 DUF2935 domain-containing protein [Oscillibacter valericigenes]
MDRYVTLSLELHLFFARIMKEHALFLEAGFTSANEEFVRKADFYKRGFESVLRRAIGLSHGITDQSVLESGELFTEFTANAERQTQCFTGIPIDRELTAMAARLRCGGPCRVSPVLCRQVRQLNETALRLLDGLIGFKETTLKRVLACRMFTMNYPLLLEHIIREAKLYRTFLRDAERCCLDGQTMKETEVFWNQIMMEHAQFIRGLLDPTEDALIKTSDAFAQEYAALLARAREANDAAMGRQEALKETLRFRDFKTAGVQGITGCKIRSVILPLLADHVLREANHYIRLLSA